MNVENDTIQCSNAPGATKRREKVDEDCKPCSLCVLENQVFSDFREALRNAFLHKHPKKTNDLCCKNPSEHCNLKDSAFHKILAALTRNNHNTNMTIRFITLSTTPTSDAIMTSNPESVEDLSKTAYELRAAANESREDSPVDKNFHIPTHVEKTVLDRGFGVLTDLQEWNTSIVEFYSRIPCDSLIMKLTDRLPVDFYNYFDETFTERRKNTLLPKQKHDFSGQWRLRFKRKCKTSAFGKNSLKNPHCLMIYKGDEKFYKVVAQNNRGFYDTSKKWSVLYDQFYVTVDLTNLGRIYQNSMANVILELDFNNAQSEWQYSCLTEAERVQCAIVMDYLGI